jgi:hypothetical protein
MKESKKQERIQSMVQTRTQRWKVENKYSGHLGK